MIIIFEWITSSVGTAPNFFSNRWLDPSARQAIFFEQITWPVCRVGIFFFQMDNLIPADGFLFFSNGWLDPCAWLRTAYTRLFVWKQQIERNVFRWEVTNVETLAINYFFLLCKFKYKRSLSYLGMRMIASYSSAALVSYAILCSISNLVSFFLHISLITIMFIG